MKNLSAVQWYGALFGYTLPRIARPLSGTQMQFILVDDHALIVQALSALLKAKYPDSTVRTGSSADEARALVSEFGSETDLMILDLNMPGVTATTALLEELVQCGPAMKILVLSGVVDPRNIMRVLQLGAAGFVPKSLDTDMLTTAIDFVLKGGVFIPTKLLSESQKSGIFSESADTEPQDGYSVPVHLTERQKQVLMTLAKGYPIKRICREFNLSEGTVKTHVAAIYRAFGARNRTEALIAARRAGFDITVY